MFFVFCFFLPVNRFFSQIIYIDFGRDEKLSIYNDWKFNNFVNKYYAQVQNYSIGEVTERLNEQDDADKASFLVKYYEIIDYNAAYEEVEQWENSH